ncbi:MAG: hypothetical protein JXA71_11480, partial [Chitinispirillaceae bacterium]|nr:hypothetical protein [Chitinispirillaceae bacterium]
LEPALRLTMTQGAVDASLRCAFRTDDSDPGFESYVADSRVFRIGLEASVAPFERLSFNLFADYQYRNYAPYGARSRKAENMNVAASAALKL